MAQNKAAQAHDEEIAQPDEPDSADRPLDWTASTVLDPRQLERIEAVHTGYLYQHLYAVGCLLLSHQSGTRIVKVERDEDIELSLPTEQVYIQVKKRAHVLVGSDIRGALERFDQLRVAHAQGTEQTRRGNAWFCIVSNVPPGPSLVAEMTQPEWPKDVNVHWPGHKSRPHDSLPPAWTDISEALRWCATLARSLPFSTLQPETLVWKLAGCVMSACSGTPPRRDHAFSASELSELFEQLVVQAQQFPVAPEHYRPQEDEPPLYGADRIRIISGFSGAGKTAWASQAAIHTGAKVVYFDASNLPAPALHGALVREVAARLFTGTGVIGTILLPGVSGLDALRLLDQQLSRDGTEAVVVLDNAHLVPAENLRAIATATSTLRFILLCQPNSNINELASMLAMHPEQLSGWSVDAVAEEALTLGAQADFPVCQRVLDITGGLPLYVQSALRLACSQYDGSVRAMCDALANNSNVTETAQEVILSRFYGALPNEERDVLALLSEVDCPLKDSEAASIVQRSLAQNQAVFFKAVRRLVSAGAIQILGQRRLKIHDAIRMLGRVRLTEFSPETITNLRIQARETLKVALLSERDLSLLPPFVRMLSLTGDVETLVDLANAEMFHEMGLAPDFRLTLDDAARTEGLDPNLRFWALDCLAFAELQGGELLQIPTRLDEMEALIADHGLGRREQLAAASKRMLFQAHAGDGASVERFIQQLNELAQHNPEELRLHQYNAAYAMYLTGDVDTAKRICASLVNEYLSHLGITFADVFAKNPPQIWPLLRKTISIGDDLKHLADCLDLASHCCIKHGEHPGLRRLHAFKFYTMANAISSAMKVGQEYVSDCLEFNDPNAARFFLEQTLLPAVYKLKLMAHVVPVRGLYALTLAYCGDFDGAEREMHRLAPFETTLSEANRRDMDTRRRTIAALRSASVPELREPFLQTGRQKIGRNDKCPCGSGLKFKRCHAVRN